MTTTSSAFDFLLGDLSATPADHQKVNKKETVNALDWLYLDNSTDVSAPHPDAFELELESSLAALGGLDSAELAALQSITTTVDSFNPADFGLFTQYRSSANNTYSAYSGYDGAPSTITASSETLSTYGSQYEPFQHKLPTGSSAALDAVAAVSNSGAQHHLTSHSGNLVNNLANPLSSLFPDIDLNFTAFNLGAVAATAAADSTSNSSMLPRLTLDIDSTNTSAAEPRSRSRGSSSAYDSASPPSADLYYSLPPTSAGSNVSPYMGSGPTHPSLAGGLAGVPTSTAPANTLAKTEVSRANPAAADVDPRRKYQCPTCPRAFARAFNLKTHMATHDPNRVKNFVCRHSGCGRSFSRKHDLGRHLVSIHQDTSVIGGGPSAAPTSPNGSSNKRSSPTIGVGAGDKQRVWCDNCGRGWLAGSRDACDCEDKEE
ncbi:hypothetical protein FS837_003000 [Tulasnella sp. UAMH 9824]|nr:hypothetical protein FS837_003000 [Tulasnella sp. UAMH 9824]